MRGTHYGADYRWFTRFIGNDVSIPKVELSRDEVDQILAQRGLHPSTSPVRKPGDASAVMPTSVHAPGALRKMTGADEPVRAGMVQRGASGDKHRPGSLKAAMARARAQGASASKSPATMNPVDDRRRLAPDERPLGTGVEAPITPEVSRLANMIADSVSPRELGQYSFEQLLQAFRVAHMHPAAGAKIVQAWAYDRKLSPEQVVAAMKRVKDDWLNHVEGRPNVRAMYQSSPDDWNYDEAVADYLGQRNNVGQGPKDIDRERLMLLRRLVASFSGQAHYGFSSGGGGSSGGASSGGGP